MRHLAQTDSAQFELTINAPGPPTGSTPAVTADVKLRFSISLGDKAFLSHDTSSYVVRNGIPNWESNSRPSSSELAVVTMVISIPCSLGISS